MLTILRRHTNIRKALQYALRVGLIPSNPAVLVERPKPGGHKAAFCNEEELRTVLAAVKGDPVEFAVITAAFCGLRRSEIVGLKWDAINFQKKTKSCVVIAITPIIWIISMLTPLGI